MVRTPKRNELSLYLQSHGVSTGVHYKPIHLYPLYNKYELPVAEAEWETLLTLPASPGLTEARGVKGSARSLRSGPRRRVGGLMLLRPVEARDLETIRELRNRHRAWFFDDSEIDPEKQRAWFDGLGELAVRF